MTLALVRYRSPIAAASLARAINQETELVAASPAYETARLLTVFGVGVGLVRAFALLLMAASGVMLFVALAQALEDRRHDLAILRSLGASRAQVAGVLLTESLLLAAVGGVAGLALAHGAARRDRRVAPAGGTARLGRRALAAGGVGGDRTGFWAPVYWRRCGRRGARIASTSPPRLRMPDDDASATHSLLLFGSRLAPAGGGHQHRHSRSEDCRRRPTSVPLLLPERDGVVSWKTLAQVEPVKKDGKIVPEFSRDILALDRKDVKVQGFMIPLDVGEKQKRFLIAAVPPHCSFCLPAGRRCRGRGRSQVARHLHVRSDRDDRQVRGDEGRPVRRAVSPDRRRTRRRRASGDAQGRRPSAK